MKLIKIFISSVQAEFYAERKAMHENLVSVPLLGIHKPPMAKFIQDIAKELGII